MQQATSVDLFFSNASITATVKKPSPNKRGLHCLSVSLTRSLTGWTLHDATTLSDWG
jgi:hypothetical protein